MRKKAKGFIDSQIQKQTYSFLIISIALILAIACITVSLAWFMSFEKINPDLSFTAGEPEGYPVYKITCTNDTTSPVIEEIDSIGTKEFEVDNLQFGKITNLGMLENSNFIYYCIKIPKSDGGNVSLGVAQCDVDGDGKDFKIYLPVRENDEITYDGDGRMITTELTPDLVTSEGLPENTIPGIESIENSEGATFIDCFFAISATSPENLADVNALNALFTGDEYSLDVDENGDPIPRELTMDISEVTGDYYYAYVKLVPNVSIYARFIDYLWNNMPFFLAYEIRMTFQVTP